MKKILIAEDDLEIQRSLREYLILEGYQVLEAADGKEALELWQLEKPDLLILDIIMPKVSGIQVLQQVRSEDPNIPILMLSAIETEELQIGAFEKLADDYVTKPFSVGILMKRVQSLLRRSGSKEDTIELGQLRISHSAYQTWWNGREIELTSKEFELLWTLVQERGKVLARTQLLDQIWGYDYIGDERVVDAHIKNLRHKLPVNLIRTVKGRGYTLDEKECLENPA